MSDISPKAQQQSAVPRKVLFVCNDTPYFIAHRVHFAMTLIARGAEVHLIAGGSPIGLDPAIKFHPIDINRHNFSLRSDAQFIFKLRRLCRDIQPDVVHMMTIKPNLYGGLALSFPGLPKVIGQNTQVVMTFPGLGRVFEEMAGPVNRLRHRLVSAVLKRSSKILRAQATFENPADCQTLVSPGIFPANRTHVLFGAGIPLGAFYTPKTARQGQLNFLFASRLLRAKGVGVFIEAARLCKQSGSTARFVVAGLVEPSSPDAFDPKLIEAAHQEGAIDFIGAVASNAMPELLRSADVVCLPTQLREGFPRILIEAAACGCALIASKQPSIGQILIEGHTGFEIDPHSVKMLAGIMARMEVDPASTRHLGENAAKYVRTKPVDETAISNQFIDVYNARKS